jgi:hypothetical protein
MGSFFVLIRKVTQYEGICTFVQTHYCNSHCFESIFLYVGSRILLNKTNVPSGINPKPPRLSILHTVPLLSVRAVYCRGPPPQGGGGGGWNALQGCSIGPKSFDGSGRGGGGGVAGCGNFIPTEHGKDPSHLPSSYQLVGPCGKIWLMLSVLSSYCIEEKRARDEFQLTCLSNFERGRKASELDGFHFFVLNNNLLSNLTSNYCEPKLPRSGG